MINEDYRNLGYPSFNMVSLEIFTYSFVIPHHNTPHLLRRLVDSIPIRRDIEIIVVDDGSDIDKRADVRRNDVRIIYIDKESSKGAGRARNVGMDAAKGKWLLFADADDFYKPGFIDVLDEYKDDDIEMLFYNIDSVDSDTLLSSTQNRADLHQRLISSYNGTKETIDNLLFMGFGPWRRMFRSDYIKEYGFRFEETPKGNDQFFSLATSYFAKKWKVETRTVYILTYAKESLTYSKLTKPKILADLNILRRRAKLYRFMGHPEWNFRCYRGRYFQSCIAYCYRLFKKNPTEGMKAFVYYLTNLFSIEKKSNSYIKEIKRIESFREINR